MEKRHLKSIDIKKLTPKKTYSNQPEIIVISSVIPAPTSAGEIILYRHLTQAEDWTISVVPNPQQIKQRSTIAKLISRLGNTRLHSWINDLNVIACGQSWENILSSQKPNSQNTIVLTVAHGDGCWAALRYAKKYELPLVTVFHDWWPDVPLVHKRFRSLLKHRFQELYQNSDLALCVSEEMRNTLGFHPNSRILYPIPAELPSGFKSEKAPQANDSQLLRVLYSGSLYDYGAMLAKLLQKTQDHSSLLVQIRGKNPNWSAKFRQEMSDRNLWLDFAPRSQLNKWLASADVLIVVMSFETAMKRRMETSFPSKLAEYAQFKKPIVIWGPEYCSAVQWASKNDSALCVTNQNPDELVFTLEKLQSSVSLQKHYAEQAQIAAQSYFNPTLIQQQFLSAISNLTQTHCQP